MNNNLPINWSWVKLGDVCYTTSGGTPSRGNKEYYNGNIPWVKSGELDKGLILDTEEKISEEALKNSSAKLFPKGTLLIALYGATIGKLAFLGVEAATNQAVCGIYKNENINSNFLFNFLFFKKQYLVKQSIGGAQPNISQGILKNLEIPLPPIPEQKKIVEKIEELLSGLDSGVASLKKAKEQIRFYRQSVLSAAFSGRLTQEARGEKQEHLNEVQGVAKAAEPKVEYSTQLPDRWKWVKLGEVLEVKDGTHDTPKYYDKGIPFITQKHIKNGEFVFDNYNFISEEDHQNFYKRSNVAFNDIIISMIGANRGMSTIVKTKETFSIKNVGLVKTDESKFLAKYIAYFFKSEIGQRSILSQSKGGAQQFIGLTELRNWSVPLQPLNQQTQIVEEIEKRFSEADNLEKAIDESLTKSETLRQSILKQAFEGKLV